MDPWIRSIGFPVLTVTEEPGQVRIKQSRYLSSGDVQARDDSTKWWIPLGLVGTTTVAPTALTAKEDVIHEVDIDSFYKLNKDSTVFMRVNYPPARWAKLGDQIEKLSISDKIGKSWTKPLSFLSDWS
jgi:aminopeptidase N